MNPVLILLSVLLFTTSSTLSKPTKSPHSRGFVEHVASLLKHELGHHGYVYPKGSYHYEMRRRVHNGLCAYRFPDIVVAPQTTDQVAKIVQVARKVGMEISVRSGGHSFLCNNIKGEGIHIDLRRMNRVQLVGHHAAILGPGSNWDRVLKIIPPKYFTLIHGQCLSVGVGGYLLGGGVNVVGTSERLGSGAQNVIKFTMVTAEGDVAEVTKDNVTLWRHQSGETEYYNDGLSLHVALGNAGSSFGIVTEFLYRVYPQPETLPAIAIVYLETPYDIRNLEKAAQDGRYHVLFFLPYLFHRSYSVETLTYLVGIVMLPPFLKFLQNRKIDPIFVACIDNRGPPKTDKTAAYRFLESYGLRLAKSDGPVSGFIPDMFSLNDYERVYLSDEERKKRGFQAVVSANLMGLSSLRVLDRFIFKHPVFGFPFKYSRYSNSAGCDFCYFIVVSTSQPERPILDLTETGRFQIELTCTYRPYAGMKCPRLLKQIKEEFVSNAIALGDSPTQYVNTPSCDVRGDFGHRYYGNNYEKLIETKRLWDPENVFHHCQSIGSPDTNCCPQEV